MIDNNSRPRQRIGVAMATLALAGAIGLSGCSSSGGTTGARTTGAGTTASVPVTQPATGNNTPAGGGSSQPPAAVANILSVDALDSGSAMSYEISGSPRPGRVAITFANKGKYAHEMSLFQMKDGATLDQLKAALAKSEQAARALLADPDNVITGPTETGPGRSETVTVPLAAGHYVVTCFLPGPDGMPHVMMGMIGEFTVAGAAVPDSEAPVDGTVELSDTGISVPESFAHGGTYTVKNTGTKPHDFSLVALAKPGTLMPYFQCVASSFGKGTPVDKCPGTLAGGVATLQPGKSALLRIALPAGDYGYVSTQADGADFQAGLNGTFAVK